MTSDTEKTGLGASGEFCWMDIKTRDYVAAARMRGESTLSIMLREILPNARGPLIGSIRSLRFSFATVP